MISRTLVLLAALAAVSCAARSDPSTGVAGRPPAAADGSASHENLNAVVWMQSALEFEASTLQAYRLAQQQLDAALKDPTWTAATEQAGNSSALKPAIILDIDETVLDNTYYQARLVRDGTTFSNETWDRWCEEARATAIPGAREFTRYAADRGVTVFYVSNRMNTVEAPTRANLAELGFPLAAGTDTVLLRGERDWSASAKGPRRAYISREFRVLLLIGDDLGDFVTDASGTPQARRTRTEPHAAWWGVRWIMLPNPSYGSWERAVIGGSPDPQGAKRRALRTEPAAVDR
jgi:5'-nucleotidase (lipoprotein e(P4) family)